MVTGLRLTFSTMQNNERIKSIDYFVADIPKTVTTDCIGPNCSTGCGSFVEVVAFPRLSNPINSLIFSKVGEELKGFGVCVGKGKGKIVNSIC